MPQNEIFEINGLFYVIDRDKYEPREIYLERVWFIIRMLNSDTSKTFDEICVLSRIYTNIKNKKCIYNESIMTEIKKYS